MHILHNLTTFCPNFSWDSNTIGRSFINFINYLMSPRFSTDYKIKSCHLPYDAQTWQTHHEIHKGAFPLWRWRVAIDGDRRRMKSRSTIAMYRSVIAMCHTTVVVIGHPSPKIFEISPWVALVSSWSRSTIVLCHAAISMHRHASPCISLSHTTIVLCRTTIVRCRTTIVLCRTSIS